jgi:hypothetical protein
VTEELAIQRALSRKRVLEEEIRKIDNFLELYREFSEGRESPKSVENVKHVLPASASSNGEEPAKNVVRTRGMSQGEFETLARQVTLENGLPLSGDGILEALHKIGRRLGGNEAGNLKTKLWRATAESKTLVRIPGSGFWPADVTCEAVKYYPEVK